jgi:membrane protease YdiL (CAAX protease family)
MVHDGVDATVGAMVRRRALAPSGRLALFAGLVLGLEAVTVMGDLDPAVTPFVLVLIPAVAAVGVSALSGGRAAVGRLTGAAARTRVGMRWYVVAVGIPVADKLIVDLAGTLLGRTTPDRLLQALTASAIVVPLVVLIPGLLEELGWRGFGVQTAVEQGHSPMWAVAVIAPLFIALHIPLYLPGQLYAGLALWPLPINLLAVSVLLTWVYLRTRSVLVTGLMHAGFNATVPLTWGLDAEWAWAARSIVLTLIAALVVGRVGITWWRTPQASADQLIPDRRRRS